MRVHERVHVCVRGRAGPALPATHTRCSRLPRPAGCAQRELLHIVHHGRSGGVYKAWAASEAEARQLVARLHDLQSEVQSRDARHLEHVTKALASTKAGAKAAAKSRR